MVEQQQQQHDVGDDASFARAGGTSTTLSTTTGVRHEYVYFGTREEGSFVDLVSVSIVGENSAFFRVDHSGSSSGQHHHLPTRIGFGECASIRISFVVDESNREEYLHQSATATNARMDAVLVLSVAVAGGQQQVDTLIELRVDFAQEEDSE